ncbi:MAG: hypothetical protein AAB425_06085 [Bdellovibrionota bacterium]
MKIMNFRFPVLLLLLSISWDAMAASRTIQFTGVASSYFTTVAINNATTTAVCTVVVANTGATDQYVERVRFIEVSYTASTKSASFPDSANGDHAILTATTYADSISNASTGCTATTTLSSGGICIFRFSQTTLPWNGRTAVCSGQISVKDKDASKPGSVTASGAISLNQESLVVGGLMSGAMYLSGMHITPNAGGHFPTAMADNNTPFTGAAPDVNLTSGSYNVTNMNYYCAQACIDYGGWNDQACAEHCGIAYSENGKYRQIFGSIKSAADTHALADNSVDDPSDTDTYKDTNSDGKKDSPTFSYYLSLANPHFVGGLVIETIQGPVSSICSGNKIFFSNGGLDFTHADSVDSHSKFKGNPDSTYNASDGPPERLVCSHRHGNDDLHSSVGSTSPVVINGGMAF